MLLVVADTSPIRYLVQIGQIELLPRLFQRITLPTVVADELRHPSAPPAVRTWIELLPNWVTVSSAPAVHDSQLDTLDPGERAATALGLSLNADLLLIDERKGAAAARSRGLEVTGTLGILDLAAERGYLRLSDALDRLKQTNFRYRADLLAALLKKHEDAGRA
jgi:predicted nucleic acid-binding protein